MKKEFRHIQNIIPPKKYPFFIRMYRIIKYYIIILLRKKDSPESISHGFAIGIFVGFLPIIPLQAVTALLACGVTKTNKFAGILGTNIFTNALTAPFTFYLLHFLGVPFLHKKLDYTTVTDLLANFSLSKIAVLGWDVFIEMMIGGLFAAIIFYPITYVLTKKMITKYRNRGTIVLGKH